MVINKEVSNLMECYLESISKRTQLNTPEGSNLQEHRCENLESRE
jgi:hypothetical protein